MSIARYNAGQAGYFTATLRDRDGVAIPAADVSSLTLTLTNAATGEIVNGRNAQDVLNDNSVTLSAQGALAWTIQPADTALVVSGAASEEHVATFSWVADGGSEVNSDTHRLHCTKLRSLTTFDDVALLSKNLKVSEQMLIELLIDAFTERAERETRRRFQHATGLQQTFNVIRPRNYVRVERYPISSITAVYESWDGTFDSSTVLDADEYTFDEHGHVYLRHRSSFYVGQQTVRVDYAGGLARDVGAVPADLRAAATQQVAYWYDQRDRLGIRSQSFGGASVTTFADDWLPFTKSVVESYQPLEP